MPIRQNQRQNLKPTCLIEVVFPYEDASLRAAMGMGTVIAKTLLIEREFLPGRTTVILVRQPIGV